MTWQTEQTPAKAKCTNHGRITFPTTSRQTIRGNGFVGGYVDVVAGDVIQIALPNVKTSE